MGGILDVTFKPYVQRQINARQMLLNQESRDPRFFQYTNAKNAWCRMTSLVNYDSPDGKYKGDQLSRKYVLESGVLYNNPSNQDQFALRRGIGGKAGSYGSLGDGSFGIRPTPGIVNIELKNRGALGSTKEAIVRFMAWDKGQIDELEVLFLRPGYSVLIEFGWSLFLDTYVNDGDTSSSKVVDQVSLSKVSIKNFLDPTINAFDTSLTPPDIYKRFEFLRHKFSGNYEGFVGKIRNFSIQQLSNGGFECTTTIIAISDVLDTLKINSSTYPLNSDNQDNSNKSNNRLLTRFEQIFLPITDYSNSSAEREYIVKILGSNINKYQPNNSGDLDPNIDLGVYPIPYNSVPSSLIGDKRKNLQGSLHYISFGCLIAILNTQFGLYDPRGSQNIPLVNLETPYPGYGSYGNGLCICSEDTISIDPCVCLINNPNAKFVVDGTTGFNPDVSKNNKVKVNFNPFTYNTSKNLGIIANIYVCVEYVVQRFREMSSTSDGTVDMHKFLKSILEDISYCLGSVNQFEIFTDDSTAAIIDAHFIEDPSQGARTRFMMNYLGKDSTVRYANIISKIFESQATMVAIGAGVRANIAGVQTSTYNLLNRGLTDRLILQTLDVDAVNGISTTDKSTADQQEAEYKQKLAQMVIDLRTYVQSYLQKGDLSQVLANKQAANSNLNSVIVKINTDTNFKALIPIHLELTVDGVSGMVIGNVFRINPDSLPKDYVNKNIAFRIVGLSHTIENSDWVTHIKAQCCLLDTNEQVKLSSIKTLNKDALNSSIAGLYGAMIQKAEEDRLKQVYIYNNIVRLIVSIFGPKNRSNFKIIDSLLNINNIFQPGYIYNTRSFSFVFKVTRPPIKSQIFTRLPSENFNEESGFDFLDRTDFKDPNIIYDVTGTSFPGYPQKVIKDYLYNNIQKSDFLNKVKIDNRSFSSNYLSVEATQYVLNPVSENFTEIKLFARTLIQNYPDYTSLTDDLLKSKLFQFFLDMDNNLNVNSDGIVKMPIMYIIKGQDIPAIYQNLFINVKVEPTTDFE
jgi:hypothetical protein